MAISPTVLTSSGSATDATSYATASISPSASKLILLFVSHRRSTDPATTPTVSGASMTWTQVVTQLSSPNNGRTTLFRSLNTSPGSGALTIDFSGETQQNCHWMIVEVAGIDISGSNGAGAIVQSAGDNPLDGSTSSTVTLASISSANNATFGGITKFDANNISPGSGFSELAEVQVDSRTTQAQWQIGTDNTVDWSFAASNDIASVAVEIKVAPESGGTFFMSS